MSEKSDVFVTVYATIDQATKDFDTLVKLVENKKITTAEGVLLLEHDADGEVRVKNAADPHGKFVEHRIDSGIEKSFGAKLPKGSAGVIVMVDASDRETTKAGLADSMMMAVSSVDGDGLKAFKEGLENAARPGVMQATKPAGGASKGSD